MLNQTVTNSNAGVKRRFLALLPEIMLNPELSPNARVVYAILVNAHFEGQDIVIGLDRIAGHLGKDRRAACKALAQLKTAKLIRQLPSKEKCNVNRFTLACSKNDTTNVENPASSLSGRDNNETTNEEVVAKTSHELCQNSPVSCDKIDTQPKLRSLNLIPNRAAAAKNDTDVAREELVDILRRCGFQDSAEREARWALEQVGGIRGGDRWLIGWIRYGLSHPETISKPLEHALRKVRRGESPPPHLHEVALAS